MALKAVRSVIDADYPAEKREIVVLEETDTPRPMEGPGVKYHTIPVRNLGVAFARNTALEYASHEILIFTDDDCEVDKNWLKEIVRPLMEDEKVAAAAGGVRVPECGPLGQCENIFGFPGGGVKFIHAAKGNIINRATFSTCNCAVRKGAVTEAGGFPRGLRFAGEDEILSRRITAKHPLLYNPRAVVYHAPRKNLYSLYVWLFRRGLTRWEMLPYVSGKLKYIGRIIFTSPLLRLAAAVWAGHLLPLPLISWLGAVFLLYYFGTVFRYRWALHFYRSGRTMMVLPLVKLFMDLGMDIGTLFSLPRLLMRNK